MNQEKSTQLRSPKDHFSVLLSPTPRGARLARLLATEWLRTRDLPHRITEAAEHLVAELAANAATHGRLPGRDFRLALLARSATLRIEVTDTRGDNLPHRRPPSPDAESGRGLFLVDTFADRWGVKLGPVPRKTVWAELDLPPDPDLVCSGAVGGLSQGPREGKKPHQAPPLPPTAQARHTLTRAGEHHRLSWIPDGSSALRSAQHDTARPQTHDGPRRDWHPIARA